MLRTGGSLPRVTARFDCICCFMANRTRGKRSRRCTLRFPLFGVDGTHAQIVDGGLPLQQGTNCASPPVSGCKQAETHGSKRASNGKVCITNVTGCATSPPSALVDVLVSSFLSNVMCFTGGYVLARTFRPVSSRVVVEHVCGTCLSCTGDYQLLPPSQICHQRRCP